MDRGGGVKLRALWLPVASDDDVVSQDESSLVLLSLYVGKLMGAGKEGEELKLRVSTSLAVVESRLLRKMEKGWMVGEGMVVLVDKMEGKVVLEVVDMRRDKVLGEVEVDVAEESTAIVKRQWGNISEVWAHVCFCQVLVRHTCAFCATFPGILGDLSKSLSPCPY